MGESNRKCPGRSRPGWNWCGGGCPCSWRKAAGTRWFLMCLPTKTIPQFYDSLLWCFPDSSEHGYFGTLSSQSLRITSWKPLEGESAGQDSSSKELAMSFSSPCQAKSTVSFSQGDRCCLAASHHGSSMALRTCSMCSNTWSISRMGLVPSGWRRSMLWIQPESETVAAVQRGRGSSSVCCQDWRLPQCCTLRKWKEF